MSSRATQLLRFVIFKKNSAGAKISRGPLLLVAESQKVYFSIKEDWAFCDLRSRNWSED